MSGKNAKLIRRFCEETGKRRKWLKRVWKDAPRPHRYELRLAMWRDIGLIPG